MTKGELKKEAEEYRKHFENELYLFDNTDIFPNDIEGAYLAGAKPREKRIAELENENAELKVLLDCKNCSELSEEECEVCAEASHFKCKGKDRVIKAKEIIKGLLSCCRNYPQENAEKIKQAEQFLRENDIDNAIRQANEGLDLDKIADEVEQDIKEGCPDTLCENCKKEDCTVRKLGLVPNKE